MEGHLFDQDELHQMAVNVLESHQMHGDLNCASLYVEFNNVVV
jgi:hypothetical protein